MLMYKWQGQQRPIKKINRLIVAGLVLVYTMLLLYMFMPDAGAVAEINYVEHVVCPGETLWSISRSYRPDADPREIVWLIQQASGCTALIRPGDVLLIPMKGEGYLGND